jgi:hypothetical protein
LRAIEVHDESVQNVLAPKLEAEDAAIPEQRPRVPLGGRGVLPELAREVELPAPGGIKQRIHANTLHQPAGTA